MTKKGTLIHLEIAHGGQNYLTVAKAGHSIAFGATPIGRVVQEQPISTLGPEPWFVTKISNATDLAEFRGSFSKEWRETRETAKHKLFGAAKTKPR